MSDRHWNCPVCGEGYPSSDNAGVPVNGVIILMMESELEELRPLLPPDAVVHLVSGEPA